MPNQIPVPRFKRGDRVRETHVIRLKTVKVSFGASRIPQDIKPKRGVKVPPGATIYLPVGSTCQLPVSAITTNGDPVFDAADKRKGKIKSVQVNLRKGYKGFQKVTDGSVEGAGPILSIRDAVNDRKISNLLEVQTGSPFNLDYQPPNILKDYTDRVIKAAKGTVELSRFGAEGVDPKAKNKEWVRQQYLSLIHI